MLSKDIGVIDSFAGAGGLNLGFREAGFKIVAAIEKDPDSAKTYQRNFRKVQVLGDVEDVHGRELLDIASRMGFERVFVIGVPPCQALFACEHVSL
ncbi:MAG: DNA cytosine methyltransferase [Promethearchaeati archaeon SRVP18_Atabeyarchaeia-1]